MNESLLINQVRHRMEQLKTTQAELAAASGLTQGHISKILNKRIKLADKTNTKLENWLRTTEALSHENPAAFAQSLTSRLVSLSPAKRMQFMQFLEIAERLAN